MRVMQDKKDQGRLCLGFTKKRASNFKGLLKSKGGWFVVTGKGK